MGESAALIDAIILIVGIVLILVTSLHVSRKRSGSRPATGQATALIGVAVWLGFLGVALYLIFG